MNVSARQIADLDFPDRVARAIAATFGNSLQVGVPLAAGLFGEKGLGIHIALISLHALIILSILLHILQINTLAMG